MRGLISALQETWIHPTKAPAQALNFLEDSQKRMEKARVLAREIEKRAKSRMKTFYDKKTKHDPLELELGIEVVILWASCCMGQTL